jgi:hypothetical protein
VTSNGQASGRGLIGTLLSERGLGAILAIILLIALWQVVASQQAFQTNMLAEAVRTNERLTQIQIDQGLLKVQLDRIERMMNVSAP